MILSKAEIVFCTLSGAASKEIQDLNQHFEYVIVDEACQSIELSTLIPLQYGAKHVVLVGDPMQLPATTFAQGSSKNNYSRSLFERLAVSGAHVECLEVQYRMIPQICELSSTHFY